MLEINKYIKEEHYQKVLITVNELMDNEDQYIKAKEVQLNYYKGMSLIFLNQKEEGDFFLNWVINHGNTLGYLEMAKELSIILNR